MILIERLRCLRIQVYIFVHIEFFHFLKMFYHYSRISGLSHQSKYLRMSPFTKNHNLGWPLHSPLTIPSSSLIILSFYTALQLKNHWTSSIDYLDIVTTCYLIGLRRFSMSPQ